MSLLQRAQGILLLLLCVRFIDGKHVHHKKDNVLNLLRNSKARAQDLTARSDPLCRMNPYYRLQCGMSGVSEHDCLYHHYCCYEESSIPDVPWCYHIDYYADTYENRAECEVDENARQECGHMVTSSFECVMDLECCYEETDQSIYGVPFCFIPREIATTLPPRPTQGQCIIEPLISGAVHSISNAALSASSLYDSIHGNDYYQPWHSRLNQCPPGRDDNCAWAPEARVGEYITADLGMTILVSEIATQGDGDTGLFSSEEYVASFTLEFSTDGENFVQSGGRYTGNTDSESVHRQDLEEPINAHYVRLVIQEWENLPSLRWELYGCLYY